MKRQDIIGQRMIGKQIMVVDIIQHENKPNTVHSRVTTEMLATWASIDEEEIDKLIDYCRRLHPLFLTRETAHECINDPIYRNDRNAFYFIAFTCLEYGYRIVRSWDLDQLSEDYALLADAHYIKYSKKHGDAFPVGDYFASKEVFEHTINCFVRTYIGIMNDAMGDGYDWEVICRMQGFQISEERFKKLQTLFSDN